MNVDTGQIYVGEDAIAAARARGEHLREMTPDEIGAYKSAERDRIEGGRRARGVGGRSYRRCPVTGMKLRNE